MPMTGQNWPKTGQGRLEIDGAPPDAAEIGGKLPAPSAHLARFRSKGVGSTWDHSGANLARSRARIGRTWDRFGGGLGPIWGQNQGAIATTNAACGLGIILQGSCFLSCSRPSADSRLASIQADAWNSAADKLKCSRHSSYVVESIRPFQVFISSRMALPCFMLVQESSWRMCIHDWQHAVRTWGNIIVRSFAPNLAPKARARIRTTSPAFAGKAVLGSSGYACSFHAPARCRFIMIPQPCRAERSRLLPIDRTRARDAPSACPKKSSSPQLLEVFFQHFAVHESGHHIRRTGVPTTLLNISSPGLSLPAHAAVTPLSVPDLKVRPVRE